MSLDSLRPEVKRKPAKRVGRGIGSGHGKTSGKGHKGQKARSGGVKGPAFEGGQLPLQRRLPKRGFTNAPFRHRYQEVNIDHLEAFGANAKVGPAEMAAAGLIRDAAGEVKVLGRGDITVALEVSAHAFSASARQRIEAAGGSVHDLGGSAPEGSEA